MVNGDSDEELLTEEKQFQQNQLNQHESQRNINEIKQLAISYLTQTDLLSQLNDEERKVFVRSVLLGDTAHFIKTCQKLSIYQSFMQESILEEQDLLHLLDKSNEDMKLPVSTIAQDLIRLTYPDGMDVLTLKSILKSIPDEKISINDKAKIAKVYNPQSTLLITDYAYSSAVDTNKTEVNIRFNLSGLEKHLSRQMTLNEFILTMHAFIKKNPEHFQTEDENLEQSLNNIAQNFLHFKYEECVVEIEKLVNNSLVPEDMKEKIFHQTLNPSKESSKKNDARRYYETKLAQTTNPTDEEVESVLKIANHLANEMNIKNFKIHRRDSDGNNSQLSEDLILLLSDAERQLSFNKRLTQKKLVRSDSYYRNRKGRLYHSDIIQRRDMAWKKHEDKQIHEQSVSSRNPGLMRSTTPNPMDERLTKNEMNRHVDYHVASDNSQDWPERHSDIPFVGSMSGHMYHVVNLLHIYAKQNQKDPQLNQDVNNFVKVMLSSYVNAGYHSLFEMIVVLQSDQVKQLLEKDGIKLEFENMGFNYQDAMHAAENYLIAKQNKNLMMNELTRSDEFQNELVDYDESTMKFIPIRQSKLLLLNLDRLPVLNSPAERKYNADFLRLKTLIRSYQFHYKNWYNNNSESSKIRCKQLLSAINQQQEKLKENYSDEKDIQAFLARTPVQMRPQKMSTKNKTSLFKQQNKHKNSEVKMLYQSLIAKKIAENPKFYKETLLKINHKILRYVNEHLDDPKLAGILKQILFDNAPELKTLVKRGKMTLREAYQEYLTNENNLLSSIQLHGPFFERVYWQEQSRAKKDDHLGQLLKKARQDKYFEGDNRGRKGEYGIRSKLSKPKRDIGLYDTNEVPEFLNEGLSGEGIHAHNIAGKRFFSFNDLDGKTNALEGKKNYFQDLSAFIMHRLESIPSDQPLDGLTIQDLRQLEMDSAAQQQELSPERKEEVRLACMNILHDFLGLYDKFYDGSNYEQLRGEQNNPVYPGDRSYQEQVARYDYVFASGASGTISKSVPSLLHFMEADWSADDKRIFVMALSACSAVYGHHTFVETLAGIEGVQEELGIDIDLSRVNVTEQQVLTSEFRESEEFNDAMYEFGLRVDEMSSEYYDVDSDEINNETIEDMLRKILEETLPEVKNYQTSTVSNKFKSSVHKSFSKDLTKKRAELAEEFSEHISRILQNPDTSTKVKLNVAIYFVNDFIEKNNKLSAEYGKKEYTGRLNESFMKFKAAMIKLKEVEPAQTESLDSSSMNRHSK